MAKEPKFRLRITRRCDGVIEESKHLSGYTLNMILEGLRGSDGSMRNKVEIEVEDGRSTR